MEKELQRALSKGRVAEVVEAARRVAEEQLDMIDALTHAYDRFKEPRTDPGCLAKLALLDALDRAESLDEAPFRHGLTLVQNEAARGTKRDTAGPVRARSALALARLNARDLLPALGGLLADASSSVRHTAAKAVAHYGNGDGAGLLLLRLKIGDDPAIELECLHGLFALTPALAVATARELLSDADPERREILANALGSANHDEAVRVLDDQLAECVVATDRKIWIDALALSRRPSAREALIALIEEGTHADARTAITALAPHGYDARLVAAIHEAAERRGERDVSEHARATFR